MFEGDPIMRKFTTDLATDANRASQFYTTESLGTSQELTPEGFLLCKDVPVARTGSQLYAPGEVPVPPGPNGLINVTRDEADVFSPVTLASYQGKPCVDEHPTDGKITPDTWRHKAVGVVLNPRRGDGLHFDNAYTYADLLFTDKDAIEAVRGGKRQVSVGYDADYEILGPGRARQHNIIVNHVALVDRGRCGPRCAIGDSEMARLTAFRDRIRRAVRTRDEAGVLNAVAELGKDPELLGEVLSGDEGLELPSESGGGNNPHHVTINVHGGRAEAEPAPGMRPSGDAGGEAGPTPGGGAAPVPGSAAPDPIAALAARMDQVEQILAMLVQGEEGEGDPNPDAEEGGGGYEPSPDEPNEDRRAVGDRRGTRDNARRAAVGDSSSLREGFQQMLSQAEILMPGIGYPTFDSAMPARTTFDAMCSFRRKTLEASKGTDAGSKAIGTIMGGRIPKSFHDSAMTCDAVSMVFNGAASLLAQENRGRIVHQPTFGSNGQPNAFSVPKTPADINKANAEFYARH